MNDALQQQILIAEHPQKKNDPSNGSGAVDERDREKRMAKVTMTVNGKSVSGEVEGRTLLSSFLREGLGLTGTHVGCDTSQCGACVVHVDGVAAKACSVLAMVTETFTDVGIAEPNSLGDTAPADRLPT